MAALAEDVVLDGREGVGRGHGGREGPVLRRLLVADHILGCGQLNCAQVFRWRISPRDGGTS